MTAIHTDERFFAVVPLASVLHCAHVHVLTAFVRLKQFNFRFGMSEFFVHGDQDSNSWAAPGHGELLPVGGELDIALFFHQIPVTPVPRWDKQKTCWSCSSRAGPCSLS